jgi:hypothetical protein
MLSVCLIITHGRSLVADSLGLVVKGDVARMLNAIVKNPMEAIHGSTTQENSIRTSDPDSDTCETSKEPQG